LIGSAPAFPQGVVDDITTIASMAQECKIGMHVDCCLGGFLMPFLGKIGYNPPPFDFSVRGVTSISADTHKYGFAPKGSSVIMYSSRQLRHFMYFVSPEWPGGIYASPTMSGSRAGGLIAATWAALVSHGEDGYMDCARSIMEAAKKIEKGIGQIDGLRVQGAPDMSVIAFCSDEKTARGRGLNIFKVGEAMTNRHWCLNTLQKPAAIHICCTYLHRHYAEKFLTDLQDSVKDVVENPDSFKSGSAAIYGATESVPDTSLVSDMAKGFLDALFTV
jgi:sphinganine-1-phosphate aldolase